MTCNGYLHIVVQYYLICGNDFKTEKYKPALLYEVQAFYLAFSISPKLCGTAAVLSFVVETKIKMPFDLDHNTDSPVLLLFPFSPFCFNIESGGLLITPIKTAVSL